MPEVSKLRSDFQKIDFFPCPQAYQKSIAVLILVLKFEDWKPIHSYYNSTDSHTGQNELLSKIAKYEALYFKYIIRSWLYAQFNITTADCVKESVTFKVDALKMLTYLGKQFCQLVKVLESIFLRNCSKSPESSPEVRESKLPDAFLLTSADIVKNDSSSFLFRLHGSVVAQYPLILWQIWIQETPQTITVREVVWVWSFSIVSFPFLKKN